MSNSLIKRINNVISCNGNVKAVFIVGFTSIGTIEFLQEQWSFPPGVIKNLVYPYQTSIVYIDAVPIIAMLFKLLVPLFHSAYFQYFGIWGVLCFALQGGFAAIILYRYTQNIVLITISSMFFIFSPFITGKMFGHASMSGQWILLAALSLVWYRSYFNVRRNELFLWITVCALSIAICAYFAPMVYSILCIYIWYSIVESENKAKTIKKMIILVLSSIFATIIIFWLCGGFVGGTESSGMDYGIAPFNLNGFFNPGSFSSILQTFQMGNASGEGYAYLGLGIIIALVIYIFEQISYSLSTLWSQIAKNMPFIIVSLILIMFAATNKMMFGNYVLVDIGLPETLIKLFSVFRTSARFVWPVFYMIYILVLGNILIKQIKLSSKIITILLLLIIQFSDFNQYYKLLSKRNVNIQANLVNLKSSFWNNLKSNYRHLYFIPFSGKISHETWAEISLVAVQNHLTLNTFWLGRYPLKDIVNGITKKIKDLTDGNMQSDEIIVLNLLNTIIPYVSRFNDNLNMYRIDDLFVILNKPKKDVLKYNAIQEVNSNVGTLAHYLKYLRTYQTDKLILFTARDANKIALDNETLREFKLLGLNSDLSIEGNYQFVWLRNPTNKSGIFLKSADAIIEKHFKHNLDAPIAADIDIVMANYTQFPEIKINQEDCSQQYVGLNVCVYDLKKKRIVEIGVFDLYNMTNGVWVSLGDKM